MSEEVKRFKLREEKHVASEIILMAWSPTMDLIALGNANGEVFVNRLSWQRVWSLPPFDDRHTTITVSAFSWRPDGKFLAIGYTNGFIRLCEVEKGETINEECGISDCITSMVWMDQAKSMCEGPQTYPEDNSSTYLPMAQQFDFLSSDNSASKTSGMGYDAHEVFKSHASSKELSLLAVGTANNKVHLYAYGVFHLCALELSNDDASESQVVDSAIISPDLSCLSIVVKSTLPGTGTAVQVQKFDTALLVTRHEEIRLLCSKYIRIISTELEITSILNQMSEAWEEILREMDSKLLKFAKAKKERQEGSVSNDFLELLLFGTTSLELQAFLLHDLTDKGLKKLGYSIESSYSNIQKLVVRQLQRASQNLSSQLSDLYGMSQWHDKFGVLGLSQDAVHTAMKSASEFAVSAYELQQVIDTSIKNFKAFFRWLYIAIIRLSNDQPPAEINKMTQHDVKFVADFLKDSFTNLLGEDDDEDNDGDEKLDCSTNVDTATSGTTGFRLEKVGQYLKDTDLTQPPNYRGNPWIQFLESSTNLKGGQVLHARTMQGKSMKQRKNMVVQNYTETERPVAKTIGESMKNVTTFQLFSYQENPPRSPKVSQFIDEKTGMLWTAFVEQGSSVEFLYLMRHPVKDASALEVVRLKVGMIGEPDLESDSPLCDRHYILGFAIFNPQTLTLMLQEVKDEEAGEVTLLVQLPLSCVQDSHFTRESPATYRQGCHMQTLDVGPLLSRASVSYQLNVVGHSLAVGGVRTTASMLLSSQRRIRLFLLEDGDEEDDDDDDGATTKDDSTMPDLETSNADASQADESTQDDDK